MKWSSTFAALSTVIVSVLAEDLLFLDSLIGREQGNAVDLGFTTKVVTEAQFRALTTADFSSYKAIIFGDDFGSSNQDQLQVLIDTKNVWGPAVTGNIIIHGADQSNHAKDVLINNSIKFAASGKSLSGASNTGLYFSLSQYYDTIEVANVDALSYFGTFEVRGDLSCYDKVHIVASSPAIDTLTDAYLSNWGCSVHEAFSVYPSVGINGFQAIAIADGVVFPGTQTYGDGHSGLPYIITRGATPAGCGDGKWDAAVGEECDDGNVVDGDGCSKSCKCESGLPEGDGTCFPSNTTIPIPPSGSVKPSGYTNSSTTVIPGGSTTSAPYPIVTAPPPYETPVVPIVSCIGVEIVVSVTVTELCSTIAPGTTITSTITSALATYQKPIYNTQIESMPCYVCALSSQSIAYTAFITATSTYCPACTSPPAPATIYPCAACAGTTLTAVCPWATTPPFSQVAVYTSYSTMSEKPACTTCQYTPTVTPSIVYTTPAAKSPFCSSCAVTTSTYAAVQYTPKPSSTGPVQFTGAATKSTPGSMMALFAVFGAIVVGAVALVL